MSDLVLGSLIAAGGIVVGSVLTGVFNLLARRADRRAEEQRQNVERAIRREERFAARLDRARDQGATAVARLSLLVSNLQPQRVAFNFHRGAFEEKRALFMGSWENLEEPLGTLAVQLPTLEGRDLVEQLIAAMHVSIEDALWILKKMSQNEDFDGPVREAEPNWNDTHGLARQLREALHQESYSETS